MPFDFLKPKQRQQQNQNQQTNQGFGSNRYPTDLLLGELMVKAAVITQAQLDDAVKLSANKHLQLGQMLIMAGNISPRDLQAAVDAQSMLRDRSVDQQVAARCLKIACKTGMSFADVYRDQIGQRTDNSTNKLGELLLDAHLIDREQFGKAMQRSLATGLPLGRILVLNGAISEHILNEALEIQVRIRDGMLERVEAVVALRGQIGDFDSEELQRQTMPFKAALAEAPRRKGVRLGELLVMAGLMAETDVMSALEIGLLQEQLIGEVFIAQGFVTPELLDVALELQQKVDQEILQPLEAGQALAKISATGVSLDESIENFVKPKEQVYEPLTFDKMLVLARVISADDIESALEQVLQSPQLLAQLLIMTNFLDEHTSSAVLQCYSMMSNNFLSQDDAIIALDYCLNKEVERNITFGEALSELGWSATQSLQIHAKNSVDITHIRLQAMLGPTLTEPESDAAQEEQPQMSMEDYARSEEEAQGQRNLEQQETQQEEAPPEELQHELQPELLEPQAERQEEPQEEPQEELIPEAQQEQDLTHEEAQEEPQQEIQQEPEFAQEQEQSALPSAVDLAQEQADYADAAAAAIRAHLEGQAASQPAAMTIEEEHTAQQIMSELDDAGRAQSTITEPWENPADVAAESFDDFVAQQAEEAAPEPAVTPTAAEEDVAFREEFHLEAADIAQSESVPVPVQPEPAPVKSATPAGGLMALLSSQNPPSPPPPLVPTPVKPAAVKPEGSLGQMISSQGVESAESHDALRDLFSPKKSEPPPPAAKAAPANGKSGEHAEPAAAAKPLVPVGLEASQSADAKTADPPETPKSLGGLFRTASGNTPAVESPQALATEGGVEGADPAANSSLSSVLAKAANTHVSSKFIGARATPVSTGALSPLAVPSIDKGDSLLKPESESGDAAAADHSGEAKIDDVMPAAKSTSAFAHLVAPPARKSPETEDIEESNKRVDDVSHKFPNVVDTEHHEAGAAVAPAATAPATPAASSTPASTAPAAAAAVAASPAVAPARGSLLSRLAKPAPTASPAATPAPTPTPTPAPAASAPSAAAAPAPAAATPSAPAPTTAPAAAPAAAPKATPAPTPVAAAAPAAESVVNVPAESPDAKPEVKEALGTALNRLAESYYQQGNYAEAQGLYDKILSLKQQQFGPKHPSLGGDLTNLAGVLCVQGKFAQAEPYVRRVVSLIEITEPVDVLKLAGSINTLAGILFQQGKLEECEPLLARALELRRGFLGEDQIEVADSLRDYAKLLKKLGRVEEAEKHYLQAKAIVAKRQQAGNTAPQ